MNHRSTTSSLLFWLIITGILLLGAGLRLRMLGQDVRFHSDEAFFNTFATQAAVHGDWMLTGPLDKSPLTIYANGLALQVIAVQVDGDGKRDLDVRTGEFAARIPNTVASVILIALTMRLAYTLIHQRCALILAGMLSALSPFLLVFSPSAFTDVFMLTFMVAALLATLRGRYLWAGVWLALSIWSKQQGLYYLPLLLGVMAVQGVLNRRNVGQLMLALSLGLALFGLWDVLRPDESIFVRASENNNPGRLLVDLAAWGPRLREWLGYLGWGLGPALLTVALTLLGVFGFWRRRDRQIALLWGYIGVFLLGHWVVAFNTYDRYLLPIIPLLIVVVAYGLAQLNGVWWGRVRMALLIPLLFTAVITSGWGIDLGRDGYPLDRDGEIIALAEYINAKPYETIVYDRWVGWELGYYLGPWTDIRRVYFPTPGELVQHATGHPDPNPRYFIVPRKQWNLPWITALLNAGFTTEVDYRSSRFIVYQFIRRRS